MKKILSVICILLAAVLLVPVISGTVCASTGDRDTPATYLPKRYKPRLDLLRFDFTLQTMSSYIRNENIAIGNRAAMNISDKTLKNSSTKPMSFGSGVFVGDDYGMSDGYLSFDMKIGSGKISLGVRNTKAGGYTEGRGIWFDFDNSGKIKISERDTGKSAEIDSPSRFSDASNIRFEEHLSYMTLSVDGAPVLTFDVTDGRFTAKDGNGGEIISADGCGLYGSGYFTIVIDGDTDGSVDNVEFTNYKPDENLPERTDRQIDYTTWTASDDLSRTVASNDEAGDVRDGKYVGLFYFLCWVGAGVHVQDNTKIYLEKGASGLKKYLQEKGGEAYWAEPYFGYYINTDTWVYRKHAYMLEAAGVDFIFLDVSNAVTFDKGHLALFDTWLQIRKEGGMTPQICFFCGDNVGTFETDISHLQKTVYAPNNYEKYKELFFMWNGKPLIFGNDKGINKECAEWLKDFTVRGNWAWCDKDNYWSWLQEYTYDKNKQEYKLINGGLGRDADGNFEELSVALGHHPSTSKGRSFVNGSEPNNKKSDFNFTLEGVGEGKCFEFQFNAVKQFDPSIMLITGWNEWIAGCFHASENKFFAQTSVKGYMYIDQFNPEFSRDAEPMRLRDGAGFGDNYYYQMCDYIRKFKGIGKTTEASGQKSIKLTDISTWDNVGPEYKDNIGDTKLRNTVSYDADYRYVNGTGRNDIDYAKVSQDEKNVYFLVKCTADVEKADGENFMNLFINTDNDISTGWEGYDYVINRARNDRTVTVEKFKDGFGSEKAGEAEYYIEGEYLAVKLDKSVIGAGELSTFTFKWADNSTTSGNVMEFMDLGDAAPNDRFAYKYVGANGITVDYAGDTENTETDAEETEENNADKEEDLGGFIALVAAVSVAVIAAASVVIVLIKRR